MIIDCSPAIYFSDRRVIWQSIIATVRLSAEGKGGLRLPQQLIAVVKRSQTLMME